MYKYFYIFALLVAEICNASTSQVLHVGKSGALIAVSNWESHVWKLADSICVIREEKRIACGSVIRINDKGAIVALSYQSATPTAA